MNSVLDAMPDLQMPDVEEQADQGGFPMVPPDDDDLIRPVAEELMLTDGSGHRDRLDPLAKHLVWTFGPHHRSLPFMLQLRVEVDGDRLVSVDTEIGWLHQGLERAFSSVSYQQGFALAGRLHPQNPAGHLLAWAQAVETLFQLSDQIPPAAQRWRLVVCELSRIVEHLHVLGQLVFAHSEQRAQRIFAGAARRVASLLDLATLKEERWLLTTFGGLAGTVPASVMHVIERVLPETLSAVSGVGELLWRNPAFVDGLIGRGVMSVRDALAYGVTGPALRACGVVDDVRVADPYFAYDTLAPKISQHQSGDTLARASVRLDEVAASSALILRTLATFNDVEPSYRLPVDTLVDAGLREGEVLDTKSISERATVSLELPTGEILVQIVRRDDGRPKRVRLRTPSFPLAAALERLLVGARLDDVVPILFGLGLSGQEVDR